MDPKTPIALITGSLGSGKTTLLKTIIRLADQRLAILMNEFGEISIDSRIIQLENVQMVELTGGCVCCELTGELEAAVIELIERASPDFIIVEATGVAESDALAYQVEDNVPQARLDSVVCIVDAFTSIRFPQVGYVGRTQLEAADIILVNKVDLVNDQEIQAVVKQIRNYNSDAPIIKTVQCELDINLIFGLGMGAKRIRPAAYTHQTDFHSFTFTTSRLMDEVKFQQVINDLPAEIFRAKGFICLADKRCLFNYVAGRYELENFPVDLTQLVFIGRRFDDIRDDILSALENCEI
jgi:G3E family GTPase